MQRQHVRYLLERVDADTPLARFTPARIAQILEREAEGRLRPLASGTLRKRAYTLHQALKLAGRRPRMPEIPHRYVPRIEHLPDFAAYERLRDELPAHRRLWFVAAVWTGQRSSDVERMVREDLDVAGRSVMIRSTKTKQPRRRFHAAPQLVAELADHWRQLEPGAKLVTSWPHAHSDLTYLSKRLELPRITPQRLRHTFFSWFVGANGFTAELLELGGWRDLTIPSLVYAHAAPTRLREQIERMDELIVGRRAPHKISREGEREPATPGAVPDDAGPREFSSRVAPKPAHTDHAAGEQDAIVALPLGEALVPRDRVELSTHGFSAPRVALGRRRLLTRRLVPWASTETNHAKESA
jgi:integrase